MGNEIILEELFKYKKYKKFKIFPSIRFEHYLTLLKSSKFMIGNSSSGIIEAPYYGIKTINIGKRQNQRLDSKLITNIGFNEKIIVNAIKKSLVSRKISK